MRNVSITFPKIRRKFPWETSPGKLSMKDRCAKIVSIKRHLPLHQLLYHQKVSAETTKNSLALTLFSSSSQKQNKKNTLFKLVLRCSPKKFGKGFTHPVSD
jgi:hypothetical protein